MNGLERSSGVSLGRRLVPLIVALASLLTLTTAARADALPVGNCTVPGIAS